MNYSEIWVRVKFGNRLGKQSIEHRDR